jgi:hypothetical protein
VTGDSLGLLYAQLGAQQGLLADSLVEAEAAATCSEIFGPLAVAGERTRKAPQEYGLLVESILEGYLLHYASARIVETSDPDLRLLAGDYLYAFGLTRLARLGDLEAVAELADLISLCARSHAPAESVRSRPLWRATGGLWALGVLAVGGGAWAEQQEVKRVARLEGLAGAEGALGIAAERAEQLRLASRLEQALIAFDTAVCGSFSTT